MVAGEGIEPPTRGFSILATAHRIVTGIYCYPLQTSQLHGNLSPLLRGCTDTPATPVLPRRDRGHGRDRQVHRSARRRNPCAGEEIGRAHVGTPVTTAHIVCR